MFHAMRNWYTTTSCFGMTSFTGGYLCLEDLYSVSTVTNIPGLAAIHFSRFQPFHF